MVSTFAMLLANFGYNGFTEYIIQKNEITHKEVSTIFWVHAAISLLLTAGFILISPIIVNFYKEPLLKSITIVMSISIITQMLLTCPSALLKRVMYFKDIAINNIVSSFLSTIISIYLAYKGYGYWAVVTRQLSANFFAMIFSWMFCRWIPGLPGSIKSIKESLKYTLNLYGSSITRDLEKSLDKIILGKFFGSTVLGNYDRAYQLSYLSVNQLVPPLHNVGLSTLSKLKDDPARYQKYYEKAIFTIAMIGFFLSLSLTVLGNDIIIILLGKEWKDAGLILTVFAPGLSSMIIYATISWLHLSLSQPNRMLYWNTGVVILRALTIGVSAFFGPLAVASSISILYYILLIPSIWYAGRPIKLDIKSIINGLLKFFIPALISYIIYFLLFKYFIYELKIFSSSHIVLRTALKFLFITFSYICTIIIFNRSLKPFIEMLDFIKIFLNKKSNK